MEGSFCERKREKKAFIPDRQGSENALLHFWEQVKAKATEDESQQRGRNTGAACIMESLWFADVSLPGVSPACFFLRRLPGRTTAIGFWHYDIAQLSSDNMQGCVEALKVHFKKILFLFPRVPDYGM